MRKYIWAFLISILFVTSVIAGTTLIKDPQADFYEKVNADGSINVQLGGPGLVVNTPLTLGVVAGIPVLGVNYTDSIAICGSSFCLQGDSATPGASKYYGTDAMSLLGYHSFPPAFYQTIQSNGSAQQQEAIFNFSTNFTVTDSALLTRTNIDLASTITSNTSGNAATSTAFAATPTACGANLFADAISANGNLTCATPFTLGAFGSAPSANGAVFSSGILTLEPADGTHPGGVSITTQTFAGNKTFSGSIAASNFTGSSSGSNTGDQTITLTGPVTGSGTGSFATTVGANVIANSNLAQMPTQTIKSNITGGTANAVDNTINSLSAAATTISTNTDTQGSANTFALSDHKHQLTAGAAVQDSVPQYDATNWQSVYPESLIVPSRVMPQIYDEFLGTGDLSAGSGIVGSLNWTPSFNGTGTTITFPVSTQVNHPGLVQFNTAAIATGLSSMGLGPNVNASGNILLGGGAMMLECEVLFPTLGVTAQQYGFTFGLVDTLSAFTAITNGVYFTYNNAVGANFFSINTTSASSTTSTITTTPVVANTWYRLDIIINPSASSVSFLVNGTAVSGSPISTTIPTANPVRAGFALLKSAGTTARTATVDYFMMNQRFTTAR